MKRMVVALLGMVVIGLIMIFLVKSEKKSVSTTNKKTIKTNVVECQVNQWLAVKKEVSFSCEQKKYDLVIDPQKNTLVSFIVNSKGQKNEGPVFEKEIGWGNAFCGGDKVKITVSGDGEISANNILEIRNLGPKGCKIAYL